MTSRIAVAKADYHRLGHFVVYESGIGQGRTLGCVVQLKHMSEWKSNAPDIVTNQKLFDIPFSWFDIHQLLEYRRKLVYLDMAEVFLDTRRGDYSLIASILRINVDHLSPERLKELPKNRDVLTQFFQYGNQLLINVRRLDFLSLELRSLVTDRVLTTITKEGRRTYLHRRRLSYHQTPEEARKAPNPVTWPTIVGNRYFKYYVTLDIVGRTT